MDLTLIISGIAILMFLLGTPVLLVISGWVIGTSYFVVEFPLINVGVTSSEAVLIYVFLAVPLFVATGDLLTAGGISQKLVKFAQSTVPFLPGATAASTSTATPCLSDKSFDLKTWAGVAGVQSPWVEFHTRRAVMAQTWRPVTA